MPAYDDKFLYPAWGISLGLHLAAVVLAVTFAAQVKPVLKEEIFQWNVSLVQAIQPEPASERTESVVKPVQPPARVVSVPPVEPMPETVMHRVALQQTVQMVHSVIEPVKPVEQKAVEVVKSKVELPPQFKVEPIEQQVETPQPKVEVAEAPKPKVEPVVAQSQPVTVATSAEPVEARPMHHEPVAHTPAAAPPHEVSVAHAMPAPVSHQESRHPLDRETTEIAQAAAPIQTAKAVAPGSDTKADYRWLADSLWKRVTELKRYPSSARLNGVEGKVVVKAVIRSDGHLADVSIQKSSGHPELDAAAVETVKLATPLTITQELKRAEVVVSLPIVYSLAQ